MAYVPPSLEGLTPEQIAEFYAGLPEHVVVKIATGSQDAAQDVPSTPAGLAVQLDDGYREPEHLTYLSDRLAAAVKDVESGRSRMLRVSMPPRSGKSVLTSVYLPVWLLAKHPDWKLGLISHDPGLAAAWGRDVRGMVNTHGKRLGVSLAKDAGAVSNWQTTEKGGVVARSAPGQSLTGRGFKCVSGDTHIQCEHGSIPARDAYRLGIHRILAFDHDTGKAAWRRVVAAQRTPSRRVITVTTTAGRVLTCTPDHPVYTGRGYVLAGSLRPGDALVAADPLPVWGRVPETEDGRAQSGPEGSGAVLLPGLPSNRDRAAATETILSTMRDLPSPNREPGLLLHRMPHHSTLGTTPVPGMPTVWSRVPAPNVPDGLLLQDMRGHRPRRTHDRQRQLPLPARTELQQMVPVHAPADPGTRPVPLRGLRGVTDPDLPEARADRHPVQPDHPSLRRGPGQQPPREPDHALPDLPRRAPQVESDTVAVVTGPGPVPVDVYDFQVEGTSNFFGNGLLVHNCLIIDDAVKDFASAHSEKARDALWEWWTSNAFTRLEPPFLVIVVGTRWHQDDLLGRLGSREYAGNPDDWEVIELPAIAEKGDVLGREPGDPLPSPLLEETRDEALARWGDVAASVGRYMFAALYQQRPSPAKGAIFNVDKLHYWTVNPANVSDRVRYAEPAAGWMWLDSWDMAFKALDTSDFVVGQRWAMDYPFRYLITQSRGRRTFTESLAETERWCDPHLTPYARFVHKRLVEEKANGAAIIDRLRKTVSGVKPVNPTDSKEARMWAVTPEIESGHVLLPYPGDPGNEWVGDLIAEMREAPNGTHDDQVDAFTQALMEFRTAARARLASPPGSPELAPGVAARGGPSRAAAARTMRRTGRLGA